MAMEQGRGGISGGDCEVANDYEDGDDFLFVFAKIMCSFLFI